MLSESVQIKLLLQKDKWSVDEWQWVTTYLESSSSIELEAHMQQLFLADINNQTSTEDIHLQKILIKINQQIDKDVELVKLPVRIWMLRIAAAAILIIMSVSGYLLINHRAKIITAKNNSHQKNNESIIKAGSNKAVLTLADGNTIILDDAANGVITQQGNTQIIKADGKLDYQISAQINKEILYNVITTPRGGKYQISLPDGSKVWLNAASSIRFPTSFIGKQRTVDITGEVYFEVEKDKSKPFVVHMQHGSVTVLGTHFNINAYDNELQTKTTLLEGSVNVANNKTYHILKPGEQSENTSEGKINVLSGVDVDEVMAWKNDMFSFESADIKTILRQAERWYDVQFKYEGNVTQKFTGDISRNVNLTQLLKILELTDKVHFEFSGRIITVKQ